MCNKFLLNKNVFINSAYILKDVIEGFEIFVGIKYIHNLKAINKILINNFVIDYYKKFIFL